MGTKALHMNTLLSSLSTLPTASERAQPRFLAYCFLGGQGEVKRREYWGWDTCGTPRNTRTDLEHAFENKPREQKTGLILAAFNNRRANRDLL